MSKIYLILFTNIIDEVLKELLPPDIDEIPSGFETVGDIAHMNLTGKLFDYRYLIGQIVLEKNPTIKTVVTKIGQIESTFRFYDLDCIAGNDSTFESIVFEDKVRF
jgi:tRNA (guanine37-N1)-methyltransferase